MTSKRIEITPNGLYLINYTPEEAAATLRLISRLISACKVFMWRKIPQPEGEQV